MFIPQDDKAKTAFEKSTVSTRINYSSSAVGSPVRHAGDAAPVSFAEVYFSTRQLLVVVFFLLIFTVAARPITDPDFWWHLKTGQYLVEVRTIPHTDLFSSFHFGREWVTHEWLSEAFMYSVYHHLGYSGLISIFALLIMAAFFINYYSFRERAGHPFTLGFALLVGAFATLPTWGVRPQMFSLLFASIFLALLDKFVHNGESKKLWWLVPLTICWVNLHAGFALGLGLILLTIIGLALDTALTPEECVASAWRRIRLLSVVWLVCLAAVVVNPNGIRIYSYPVETLKSHAMMKYISEWWSPDFHEPMFHPLAVLILSTFAVLALSPKRVSLRQLLLLAATCLATLRSARNVPFFALVALPLLAEHSWEWIKCQDWAQFLTKPEKRESGRSAILKMALNLVLLILVPLGLAFSRVAHSATGQPGVNEQQFPAAAVDFLATRQLPQPIYNEYGWGGYIIWRLYPHYHVYIDGRADVYGDGFLEEFLMVHDGEPNWRAPLERYGIRTVVIKPQAALASLLREDSGWVKVFEDSQAIIFTKQ